MTFDLANWALGIFTALLVVVLGTFIRFYLTGRLVSKPKLDWFCQFDGWFPHDRGIHSKSYKLFSSAEKGDPSEFTAEISNSLREELNSLRFVMSVAIHNQGRAAAEKVTLLLSQAPVYFEVYPKITIIQKDTADELVELELSSVPSNTQVQLTFYGLRPSDIMRIAHQGNDVAKASGRLLRPSEPKASFFWLFITWAFVAGLWFQTLVE